MLGVTKTKLSCEARTLLFVPTPDTLKGVRSGVDKSSFHTLKRCLMSNVRLTNRRFVSHCLLIQRRCQKCYRGLFYSLSVRCPVTFVIRTSSFKTDLTSFNILNKSEGLRSLLVIPTLLTLRRSVMECYGQKQNLFKHT